MVQKKTLFFTLLLTIVHSTIYGQQATATLSPTEILIGDHINLTLRTEAQAGQKVIFPTISDTTMGDFRLVEKTSSDTLFSGSKAILEQKYIITCFEDSIQVFPKLTFYHGLGNPIYTLPIKVAVNTVSVDSAQNPKPIKNIIQVPLTKEEIASYFFVSLLLLGLVLLIYFVYIKWIRKEELFDTDKKVDPPHVVALKKLKDVESQQLWQKGNFKEYYDNISDTVREYIEHRFGVKAMEKTTAEILPELSEIGLPEDIFNSIKEILNLSDLAKFAKGTPDEESNNKMLKYAYNFIQNTQVIYDANKKADASKVMKFYAQNRYDFKKSAVNQLTFRHLIFGVISILLILSGIILVSYLVPINSVIAYIAENPKTFFLTTIIVGSLIVCLIAYILRKKNMSKSVSFDYDSLTLINGNSYHSILFKNIRIDELDKKGNLIITDNLEKQYKISKYSEYFEEIRERIQDIIAIESKNNS